MFEQNVTVLISSSQSEKGFIHWKEKLHRASMPQMLCNRERGINKSFNSETVLLDYKVHLNLSRAITIFLY